MKILNLYAGIGGNRKLWGDQHHIMAVERDNSIANLYADMYPNDDIIIDDAHEYLLKNYDKYSFIWSSPPCPTHSVSNNFLNAQGVIRYPDMSLWQEIAFLKQFFKGRWVVENVKSYYDPLWPPTTLDRHYFWSNFTIAPFEVPERDFNITNGRASTRQTPEESIKNLEKFHGISLANGHTPNSKKGLYLRNCVYPPLGKHILDCAAGKETKISSPLFQ